MEPDLERMARISLTIGEIVYNLRAALDYTVWALAYVNTGSEVEGTQFPIDEREIVFNSRITGVNKEGKPVAQFLKGVHPDAVLLIRSLQPFRGCRWTRDLRDFSNPDKHRHLLPIRSAHKISFKAAEIVDSDPDTGLQSIRFNYDAEIEMFFNDDRPVIETMQALHREVVATIADFQKLI
jgi:hypothetical protein